MIRGGVIGLIGMTLAFLAAAAGMVGFLWWRIIVEQNRPDDSFAPPAAQARAPRTPAGGTGLAGDLEQATRQIGEDPDDPLGYAARGTTRYQMGEFAGAIEDFQRALELGDRQRSTYVGLAAAFRQLDDTDAELETCSMLLEQYPDDARTLGRRARIYRQLALWDESVADYERLAELQPTAAVFNALCWVQWGQGDYDGALESLNRSLSGRSPQMPDLLTRGAAYLYLGRYEEARADLARAAARWGPSQDYSNYYLWLATTSLGQRDVANATLSDYLDRALPTEIGDWSPTVGAFLVGDIREDVFLDDAAQGFDLPVNSQECEAYFYAGWKRLLDGDRETAAAYFQRSIDTNQQNYYEYFGAMAGLRWMQRDAAAAASE